MNYCRLSTLTENIQPKKKFETVHTVLWRIWNVDAASIVDLEQKFKLIFFIYCWNDGICVSLDMD